MTKYNMNDMQSYLDSSPLDKTSSQPASSINQIDKSLGEVGQKDLGLIGNWKLHRYDVKKSIAHAKQLTDERYKISLELGITAFRQQGDLILTQMRESYATQIADLKVRANAAEMVAIRAVQMVFNTFFETLWTDLHGVNSRFMDLKNRGVMSERDFKFQLQKTQDHYYKQVTDANDKLDAEINSIRGLRQDGSRQSSF